MTDVQSDQVDRDEKARGGDVPINQTYRNHDTFDQSGSWSPPGGDELYFHSGFSEPAEGLEREGLDDHNDPAVIQLVVEDANHSRNLQHLDEAERRTKEIEFAESQLAAFIRR